MTRMDLVVRVARESELAQIGEMTAQIYGGEGLAGPEYVEVLRDARSRWESPHTALLVAHDDGTDGVLGTVVYAAPGSPLQDVAEGDAEAEFRMLAVLPSARGRGVGENLVRACLDRARAAGLSRLVLSTGPEMLAAHRLYDRLGFRREASRDWSPRPGVALLRCYVMDLR
jgi:ribosomal protein S18 acetylase RimI-like enzyme